jgi:3-phenylpropionate/trans-cinnamate dioxygenase ferredoxin reductase component
LRGEIGREKVWVHDDLSHYENASVELRLGTEATAIHASSREVDLSDGDHVRFDKLLLATGAAPRLLHVPNADFDDIHYLRTIADSDRLRERIEQGDRLAVIGAGWIGAETAASARQKGCDVTLIEGASLPLERVLGPELGEVYRDLHTDHGVTFVGETTIERFEGSGRVERIVLSDGRTLDCDFAIIGIGVEPRLGLAECAGLALEMGCSLTRCCAQACPASSRQAT